jgi:hypothetical protein
MGATIMQSVVMNAVVFMVALSYHLRPRPLNFNGVRSVAKTCPSSRHASLLLYLLLDLDYINALQQASRYGHELSPIFHIHHLAFELVAEAL